MEWLALANRIIRRGLIARGVESRTVRLLDADVHYYRARGTGSGPPLMLVHGLGSNAHAFVRTLAPFRKAFSDVYAIDLPGNGFSPLPNEGPMKLQRQVEVLRAFRREVIGKKVFLVGNSLGGGMAMMFAFDEPEALEALALISPAGAQITPERLQQLLSSFAVDDAKQARVLAHKLYAKPPLALLLFANELKKMVNTPAVKGVVSQVSVDDLVKPDDLSKLTMPTLVIWGQREKLLPAEGLAFFRAHLPPTAELHEVNGFGHMPQMEHPRAFVERILAFAASRRLLDGKFV